MLEARKVPKADSSVVVSIQEILRLEAERQEEERKVERERALLEKQRQAAEAAQALAAEQESARLLAQAKEERVLREAQVVTRMLAAQTAQLEHPTGGIFRQTQAEIAAPRKPRTPGVWLLLSSLAFGAAAFLGVRHYEQKLAQVAAQHRDEMAALRDRLGSLPRESPTPPPSRQRLPSEAKNPTMIERAAPLDRLPLDAPKWKPRPAETLPKPPRPRTTCQEGDPMCVEL